MSEGFAYCLDGMHKLSDNATCTEQIIFETKDLSKQDLALTIDIITIF